MDKEMNNPFVGAMLMMEIQEAMGSEETGEAWDPIRCMKAWSGFSFEERKTIVMLHMVTVGAPEGNETALQVAKVLGMLREALDRGVL